MPYSVAILRRAQKELAQLPGDDYARVRDAIGALAGDPRPAGHLKLKARDGYRLRVGNYRVVYDVSDVDQLVTILHIGHRKDVYR